MAQMRLLPAGDRALVAEFGNEISPEINNLVQALAAAVTKQNVAGVEELVPTFRSLLICYDPDILPLRELVRVLRTLEPKETGAVSAARRILRIPCCYGSHFGPDLLELAKEKGMTRDEIITLHSQTDYRIYMLGFLPGFVYLGGLNKRLEAKRLSTPRVKIPKGSVGIGGSQTGVYPLDSPGGWRLIGATPVDFYNPNREQPILCQAGEYIRFEPISSTDYYDIRQMIQKGTYTPEVLTTNV